MMEKVIAMAVAGVLCGCMLDGTAKVEIDRLNKELALLRSDAQEAEIQNRNAIQRLKEADKILVTAKAFAAAKIAHNGVGLSGWAKPIAPTSVGIVLPIATMLLSVAGGIVTSIKNNRAVA